MTEEIEQNFVFQLSKKLRYSQGGEFVETATIEFTPPNMSVFDEATEFEQVLMGAMMSAAEGQSREVEDEDEDKNEPVKIPSSKEIRMLIFASQKIKVKDIAKVFKKIALKTGKLDEKEKIKDKTFGDLAKDDFMDMLCGYASFFTFPSLLRGE